MNIPRKLLEEAVRISGATTQTMAVIIGLEELIRRKRLEALLKLQSSGAVKLTTKDLRKIRKR